MSKCEDCGLDNPPDDHECAQYEERIKAQRRAMTTEQVLEEFDARLTELERRVARLSIQSKGEAIWKA